MVLNAERTIVIHGLLGGPLTLIMFVHISVVSRRALHK